MFSVWIDGACPSAIMPTGYLARPRRELLEVTDACLLVLWYPGARESTERRASGTAASTANRGFVS